MNDLERLKQAEESEPMAVLVIPMRHKCVTLQDKCPLCAYIHGDGAYHCLGLGNVSDSPKIKDYKKCQSWCPLQPAIGIIEPGCHVRYFREEEV